MKWMDGYHRSKYFSITSSKYFQIPDQEAARRAKPGEPFTFTVDAAKTGWGEVAIDVVYDNKSIRRTFYVDEVSHRVYQVTFTPQSRGKHRVFIYLNGMEVKGSPFSLRIGKDIKEARSTNRNEAFKASTRMSGRYKKLEEQKEEKRASYAEKEIFIEKPVAPPRNKREKRQSFQGFKDERQALFQSDHTTEDGMDLLPVNRTIQFDCPCDGVTSKSDINVTILGPDERRCAQTIRINEDSSFTCEFSTSLVGEHKIEIVIGDEQMNVTPNFYTYDATKIKVGQMPQGYVGLPVDFDSKFFTILLKSLINFKDFLHFSNQYLLTTLFVVKSKCTKIYIFLIIYFYHCIFLGPIFANAPGMDQVHPESTRIKI